MLSSEKKDFASVLMPSGSPNLPAADPRPLGKSKGAFAGSVSGLPNGAPALLNTSSNRLPIT